MTLISNDLDDDKIRVISAHEPEEPKRNKRFLRVYLPLAAAILVLTALVVYFILPEDEEYEGESKITVREVVQTQIPVVQEEIAPVLKSFVEVVDTVVNNRGLLILTPENARPSLVVGQVPNDSSIVLLAQAADVRSDNGKIAGSFVLNGELLSKGEAKAGFCSIIDGELVIGVADATPMFEQSLTKGGYFFRQYPLVVGGQIVENKPKGRAIRKALAEFEGKICVIISKKALTFHDFSQTLVDAGVRNAIYLVGGSSYGEYKNFEGESFTIGKCWNNDIANVNYIVWR